MAKGLKSTPFCQFSAKNLKAFEVDWRTDSFRCLFLPLKIPVVGVFKAIWCFRA
jgi:hypothetical protein